MATDQGKTSNVTGLAIMAALTGKGHSETGTTIYRPPYTARRDRRLRRPPPRQGLPPDAADAVACLGGASRARSSSKPAMDARAVVPAAGREATGWKPSTARSRRCARGVGFCDVSTLGKIDVQGPDAGAFLDRVYINTFSTPGASARPATA